jgi:Flp pilus assembly protein TadD
MSIMVRRFGCLLIGFALAAGYGAAQQGSSDSLAQARNLVEAGKLADSEAMLRGILQRQPDVADAHFLLGYVYFREQKARESLAEFTAGARSRRPDADDFRIIASDYVLLHDYPDAAKWFGEAAAERPADPQTWYLLGRAQYNEDQFEAAVKSFQHALALHPRDLEAENNLGLAWQALNEDAKAQTTFETAISWQGDHPADPQPYLNLGSLLLEQGNAVNALTNLKTAAVLAPKNPRVHEQLSQAYELLNQLPQAQAELEQAAALAPDVSALHFKLGRIYRREGLRQQAQQQFAICSKLDNAHSSAATPNPFSRN